MVQTFESFLSNIHEGNFLSSKKLKQIAQQAGDIVSDAKDELEELLVAYRDKIPVDRVKEILANYDIEDLYESFVVSEKATIDGSMPVEFHFGDANEKKYYMEQLRKLELNVAQFESEFLQAIDVYSSYSGNDSAERAVVVRHIRALDKTLDYLDKYIQKMPVLK